MIPQGVPFVRVLRGSSTESLHFVAGCICDSQGNVLDSCGTVETPLWVRSIAKPFIAAAAVKKGIVQKFGLERHEIAVMAGSHYGQPFHIEAVRSILRKIGVNESALECGPEMPECESAAQRIVASGGAPLRIHNNCSGKHAGILALCRAMGANTEGYSHVDHPATRYVIEFCATIFNEDRDRLALAVDGCGFPVFASSLRRTATAFAKLAALHDNDEDRVALKTVRDAMADQPPYIRGTGSFDTELITATKGDVIGKIGAEGLHADALTNAGLGIAVKVLDGNSRALPPTILRFLRGAGAINSQIESILGAFAQPPIRNSNGDIVGSIETCT